MPSYRAEPRSPYWVVGMNYDEPWTAVAQTNTGIVIVPCGISADDAVATVRRWHSLTTNGAAIHPHCYAVGAAVVNPDGAVTGRWGEAPLPGAASRWTPLTMILADEGPVSCRECYAPRWRGCWLALDHYGCSVCLPPTETRDPRTWPEEPDRPRELTVKAAAPRSLRGRSNAGRRAGVSARRAALDSPVQTRIA